MLCGVEAHVCVHATTVDFISRGFQASNDVGERRKKGYNKKIASHHT